MMRFNRSASDSRAKNAGQDDMRLAMGLILMVTAMIGGGAAARDGLVLQELAPNGRLRAGLAYAPAATPVFVVKDADGKVHGVPFDLATALAESLDLPLEIFVAATTGELAEA